MNKSLWVCRVGRRQDRLAPLPDGMSLASVNGRRRHQADAAVPVFLVVPPEELWQKARASSSEPKHSGNSG